jgi:ABC-type bacteriocin/lantibiotic exporter with double-glycine peptidase domain
MKYQSGEETKSAISGGYLLFIVLSIPGYLMILLVMFLYEGSSALPMALALSVAYTMVFYIMHRHYRQKTTEVFEVGDYTFTRYQEGQVKEVIDIKKVYSVTFNEHITSRQYHINTIAGSYVFKESFPRIEYMIRELRERNPDISFKVVSIYIPRAY